jgi:hypothetical protein
MDLEKEQNSSQNDNLYQFYINDTPKNKTYYKHFKDNRIDTTK